MHEQPTLSRTVRVSVPASVAYDIGNLKKSLAGVLERLGCSACCSGYDIFLQMQREGVFRKNIREAAMVGFGLSRAEDAVDIGVSAASVARIEDVETIVDKLGGLGGHPACMSGRDWRFTMEEMFVVRPESFEVDQVAVRVGR